MTIVIPCRNEVRHIEDCLATVFSFEGVKGDYEVLVVDGMSEDGTRKKLEEWTAREKRLRVLDNPGRIVPKALNIGVREARGIWVVRLDAHSTYPKNYIRQCIQSCTENHAENSGGVFVARQERNTFSARIVQAMTTHRFGVGNADFRLSVRPGQVDTVPFGCFRRELFDKIGYFDERLVRNQDYEFNRRISAAGGRIWLEPSIEISYYNQQTLRGLFRQAFVTGKWNPWTWFVAPYAFSVRHAVPAFFLAGLLLALVLGLTIDDHWMLSTLILAPYGILAVLAAAQQVVRFHRPSLLLLPVCFLGYHLTYGVGILAGIASLVRGKSPVQRVREPWPGANRFRTWSANISNS